ncbi:efflux RND transporter periplasmic adaptor subunit [Dyella choica]|uniref:Efflux RND transporter periplasmic adaptor subunit n=1 Tax=Dyella choica TaxID=1927959 RepID=A0A3S0RLK1_9GAMM|nr:efflux RND transporter periplasmic adaptor subunit [Dyella choica]RUL77483.1 efflux RND transporter periplasmic adaptor subunit [Dyella choica]
MTAEIHSGTGRHRTRWILFAGFLILTLLVVDGLWSRHAAQASLVRATNETSVLNVAVVPAELPPAVEDIVLPGTVQAQFDTPIYARTSGYLKRWYTDIGAHVKAGDLLAEIDSPEVDRELRQAEADLLTAKANARVAEATARRVHALLPTQSVSAQDDDQASSDAAAKAALVASNEANVDRLKQLVGFEHVVAPYDGIVTERKTDVGNLINAGSGSGPELFRVADTSKLRIYVQVPQSYSAQIKPDVAVALRFPEYPGRSFDARLVHTANAIDPVARTLLVELEEDNAQGELLPGGYTDVHFKIANEAQGVRVAANALLFRAEGVRIATATPDGHVVLHPVTLGRDFGPVVEVTTGLMPGDAVILNPPASLETGALVHVRSAKSGTNTPLGAHVAEGAGHSAIRGDKT